MTRNRQDVIAWLEGQIAKLKRSPAREFIQPRIDLLEAELEELKKRYPETPKPNPKDAATTL